MLQQCVARTNVILNAESSSAQALIQDLLMLAAG